MVTSLYDIKKFNIMKLQWVEGLWSIFSLIKLVALADSNSLSQIKFYS